MIAAAVAAAIAAAPIAAASLATPPSVNVALSEAAHALANGRVEQARIMIGNAIQAGEQGARLDRLLADLAFASGDHRLALARYETLLALQPADPMLAERVAITALHLGAAERAAGAVALATASPDASWRAWNARGVLADRRGNWDEAELAYERAAKIAPDQPEILNNHGWSLLARGRWDEASPLFERAARLDPKSVRIANNLELAKAAISEDLPQRRSRESNADWAARLNDAGVVANIRGDRQRAIAAFARAISARDRWFERAANNLALAEARR